MTGAPAETWRRFRFTTPPAWALLFVFLIWVGIGFFLTLPLAYLVGRHASGRLPLTRESKRRLEIPIWAGVAALAVTAVAWIVAAIAASIQPDPTNPAGGAASLLSLASLVLVWLGVPTFVLGVVLLEFGVQLGPLPYGPRAKVKKQVPGQPDRVVELQRLHPAFVEAVLEMQRSRTGPDRPPPRGSN
jgi:ABC-type dipeptide/oligopeptide/nickel transport system permease component